MSSKFTKKLSLVYKRDSIEENEEYSDMESDINTERRNKFDILNDYIESSEEIVVEQIIESSKVPKSKVKKKKGKLKNLKEKELSEDELLEKFALLNQENSQYSIEKDLSEADELNELLVPKIRYLNERFEYENMFGPNSNNIPNNRNNHSQHRTIQKWSFGKRNPNWPIHRFTAIKMISNNNNYDDFYHVIYTNEEYCDVDKKLWVLLHPLPTSSNQLQNEQNIEGEQTIQQLFNKSPYHPNLLLYLAKIFIQQEDYSQAEDCWKRIFFLYETICPSGYSLLRSCNQSSSLNSVLSRRPCSLDYSYRPSRPIFIALFQWILNLCHKSCFKTALEYCKVLYGLNMELDPLAITLLLDDLCFRSNQCNYLIQFYNVLNPSKHFDLLPNYSFSLPLAHFTNSNMNEANSLIQKALIKFPTFISLLQSTVNIQFDSFIRQCKYFNQTTIPQSLQVLMQLYITRSSNLWNQPTVIDWLALNASQIVERFNDEMENKEMILERNKITQMYWQELPLSIQRHLYLCNLGNLDPSHFISTGQFEEQYLVFDPVPPLNSHDGFDYYASHYQLLSNTLDRSWIYNFIRSFLPSFS